jgi:hypothetical protein
VNVLPSALLSAQASTSRTPEAPLNWNSSEW